MGEVKPYLGTFWCHDDLGFWFLFCKMGVKLCRIGLLLQLDEGSYVNRISTRQNRGIAYDEPLRERIENEAVLTLKSPFWIVLGGRRPLPALLSVIVKELPEFLRETTQVWKQHGRCIPQMGVAFSEICLHCPFLPPCPEEGWCSSLPEAWHGLAGEFGQRPWVLPGLGVFPENWHYMVEVSCGPSLTCPVLCGPIQPFSFAFHPSKGTSCVFQFLFLYLTNCSAFPDTPLLPAHWQPHVISWYFWSRSSNSWLIGRVSFSL